MTKAMREEVMEHLQHLESKTRRLERTVLILAMLKLGEMLLKMKERFLTSPEGKKVCRMALGRVRVFAELAQEREKGAGHMKKGITQVTLKTAKALAEKVLGTAKGLAKDKECPFDRFTMQAGMISVRIQPAYYSGGVSVEVGTGCNGRIYMLFDPVTLEQNYEEEDIQRSKDHREELDTWVGTMGPEFCKKRIDESWNRDMD